MRWGGRLLALIPVWLGISLLAFGLGILAPGDPATVLLQRRTGEPPGETAVRELREELGLDDPVPVRFGRWVADAVRGDLGRSYRTGEPVLLALARRLPDTLTLALPSLFLALALAVPAGVASAMRRGRPADHLLRVASVGVASIPGFWLAYLLILFFSLRLGLLPVAGQGGPAHAILPVLTLTAGGLAGLSRLTRASILEELEQDYVRTARAKGLSEREVVLRHCLPNAAPPLVTIAAVRFGHLLAGAVVVEWIFAWPGIGKYALDAIYDRDYPVIQGFVLFTGTVFILVNLAADVLHEWLDPRLRAPRGSA